MGLLGFPEANQCIYNLPTLCAHSLNSKCLANRLEDWHCMLEHMSHQLLGCCQPVGHPAQHLFNQWCVRKSIQVSQAGAGAATIRWFIHAFSRPQQSRPIEAVLIQTQMSLRWLDSAELPAHLELLAAKLTSWRFYPPLDKPERNTLLSSFKIQEK